MIEVVVFHLNTAKKSSVHFEHLIISLITETSFLLYRFLAVPKMGTATSIIKIWVGDSPTPCWQGKGVVKHDIHLTWSVLTWL